MGYALAAAAAARGWDVELVSGPVQLDPPKGVKVENVVTGEEMYHSVREKFADCDILIMTAAIMDYRPKSVADHKIKKFELEMVIEMEPVIDVLASVSKSKTTQVIVGFAAETDHIEDYARKKLLSKNADFIVANQIGGKESAFESDNNRVLVLTRKGEKLSLGPLQKSILSDHLLDLFEPLVESARIPVSSTT